MVDLITTSKKFFFDVEKVMKAVDRARRTKLARGGAIVRTFARRSMQFRANTNKHSPIGTPPRYHTRGFNLRGRIFFAFDPSLNDVVIGPDILARKLAPLHEFGGSARIKTRTTKWIGRGIRKTVIKYQTAKFPPRPYMFPALINSRSRVAAVWKNSIRSR